MSNNKNEDNIVEKPYDATKIFQRLEEIARGQMSVSHTRESDIKGNKGRHRFILHGWNCFNEFFIDVGNFVEKYDPNESKFSNASKGYMSFSFDEEDITNTPPESSRKYSSTKPNDAKKERIIECGNCRDRTEESIPSLKLVYQTESDFEPNEIETVKFCTSCSPAHYDDVARSREAFGIKDGEVTNVKLPSWTEYEEDNPGRVKEEHPEKWVDLEEIDCRSTNATIKVIERYINN